MEIDKLYVKYDKKLIFKAQNISFLSDDKTSRTDMKIKFTVERLFDKYHIIVDEYYLKDPHLKAFGDVFLDPKDISYNFDFKVYINNFKLQFHKKLKYVVADKCYVDFTDGNFYFTFKDPSYEGINLDGSKVAILDYDKLKLDLRSKDIIKKPLLDLLANYEIDLPISQEYGINDVYTSLMIPFDIEKEMGVYTDVRVKNAKIFVYDTPLLVDNALVELRGNSLDANGKILKIKAGDENLTYDVDLIGNVDFVNDMSKGSFFINSGSFNDLSTKDTSGRYKIYFKKDFITDLFFDNSSLLNISDQYFVLNNTKTRYKYSTNLFSSKIKASHVKYPLTLDLNDTYFIKSGTSKGNGRFKYANDSLLLDSNEFNYSIDYENEQKGFNALVHSKDINGTFLDREFVIKNTIGELIENNKSILGNFKIDSLDENIKFNTKIFDFNLSTKESVKILANTDDFNLSFYDQEFDINGTDIEYIDNRIVLKNKINSEEKKLKIDIENRFFIDEELFDGNFTIKSTKKNKYNFEYEKVDYEVDYSNGIVLYTPQLDMEYTKDEVQHYLLINNFKYLNKYFKEINGTKDSSVYITSNDFDDINITVANLYLDINSSKYKGFFSENNETNITTNIYLNGYDGKVVFNGFTFNYDKVNLTSNKKSFMAELQKEKTKLEIGQHNAKYVISSNYVQNSYVNTLFGKNWFEDGKMDLFITKENNHFSGKVNFHKTVLKDVRLVNNLLLFINTTPAIVNPLLAVPTLFRLTQTGFELDGYYMDDGYMKFVYDTKKDHLNIFDFKTNGKMNDFKGKVYMDIPNNKIDGLVDVVFMKDYAAVIHKIPLFGYLFLGDDGDIQTSVDINGTIDKPQFQTNTIKGMFEGVGNTLKRALGQ